MKRTAYDRIGEALQYLRDHREEQPPLDALASGLGYSPGHFQRLFQEWAGLSPKAFLQYLTVDYAKQRLAEADSVLDASLEAGLSGPGRLHDHFVKLERMTPGEYKRGGSGVVIRYGVFPSPFGDALFAGSERGLSYLGFVDPGREEESLEDLVARWPRADYREDRGAVEAWWRAVFPEGGRKTGPAQRVPLYLRGTPFQVQVWEALLRVPEGALVPYSALAGRIGKPGASRAVGRAVGANPVSYLIPCHRVIRSMGLTGQYHWGAARKQAMIGWEAVRVRAEP
jgi:AraC family transcriptional regulator of adaptative response/methylated-DNA-[protein]-cysteine methyltransferase